MSYHLYRIQEYDLLRSSVNVRDSFLVFSISHKNLAISQPIAWIPSEFSHWPGRGNTIKPMIMRKPCAKYPFGRWQPKIRMLLTLVSMTEKQQRRAKSQNNWFVLTRIFLWYCKIYSKGIMNIKTEWILCPISGKKTHDKIREDTEPLYCLKYRQDNMDTSNNQKYHEYDRE